MPGRAAGNPNSHTQPLVDGCQRSDSLILAASTPEWTYVNAAAVRAARLRGDRTAGRRTVEGVVHEARPAGEDIYLSHDFHDFNVMIDPDPQYEDTLSTANLAPGDENGMIEGEWEVRDIPLWAWPGSSDRIRAGGNWNWDCGHWGNSAADPTGLSQLLVYDPVETVQDLLSPGAIRGESTELHPLYEVTTFRADAAGFLAGQTGPRRLSQLDVWINGAGDPAHSIEECALLGITNWVLARVICSPSRDVGGTYSYTMQLGPKPSPGSRIVVNPLVVHGETAPELKTIPVTVTPDPAHNSVTVRFTLPHTPVPERYGLSVIAGWTGAAPAVMHHVRLDRIHIQRSLDGASEPNLNPFGVDAELTPAPGEWVLYANVNGRWVQIPGIAQTNDGQTVELGISFDIPLPAGVTPILFVSGHECDEPLMDCINEGYGNQNNLLATIEAGFNDRPGRIQDEGHGVPMLPGTNVYRPPANPDPGSGNEDLSDAVCGPDGCYQITATWSP